MTSSSIPVRARALAALIALIALGAALSACGSSSSSGATTSASATTSTAGGTGRAGFGRLRACLQQQGVTLPRPPAGSSGTRPPAGATPGGGGFRRGGGFFSRLSSAQRARLQAAMQKCGAPAGGFRRFGGPNVRSAAFRRALVAYVACVRRNGFDLPAPNTSGSGPVFDASKVNRQDPKFVAANAKCQQLLAAARPAGAQPPPGQAAG